METQNKWRCCPWLEEYHQYLQSFADMSYQSHYALESYTSSNGTEVCQSEVVTACWSAYWKDQFHNQVVSPISGLSLPFLISYFLRFLDYPALNLSKLYLPYCNGGRDQDQSYNLIWNSGHQVERKFSIAKVLLLIRRKMKVMSPVWYHSVQVGSSAVSFLMKSWAVLSQFLYNATG